MVIPDVYLNAGGVTVSYFEWLKNLSHVRFGRLESRFEENTHRNLLKAMESVSGVRFSESGTGTIGAWRHGRRFGGFVA